MVVPCRPSSTLFVEKKRRKKQLTMKELVEKTQRNPSIVESAAQSDTKTKKTKRTRKRVRAPKQTYLYASQRQALKRQGKMISSDKDSSIGKSNEVGALVQARKLGLVNAAAQHTDALTDTLEPKIMGQIRVGDKVGTSGSLAYVIYKPAGWSILGSGRKKKSSGKENIDESILHTRQPNAYDDATTCTTVGGSGSVDIDHLLTLLDNEELEQCKEIMALLAPEEREQYIRELAGDDANEELTDVKSNDSTSTVDKAESDERDNVASLPPELEERKQEVVANYVDVDDHATSMYSSGARIKRVKVLEEDGSVDVLQYDEREILALMTPEELDDFYEQGGFGDVVVTEKARKSRARSHGESKDTSFGFPNRPSIVAWLKDLKALEGTPIRGGKYWTSVAGATSVDDTGLVVICPKDKVDGLIVEHAEYVAVVGNGKYLAPKSKMKDQILDKQSLQMETIAKLRKGRDDDVVLTVGIKVFETKSTCNALVEYCQSQFLDGIRGDPVASPLDRRASRRLLHCNSISLSSLVHDDNACVDVDKLPDDIAILSERRNKHEFVEGSFLGRSELRRNPLTTAYREINGAADGFPGWIVDRYDKWLFVQHDDKYSKGPLPSIHDGNTAGVYYLRSSHDRSAMGSREDDRPLLLEGQAAPDVVPILENGVIYHVSLNRHLSTGIFLDQRQQRAWLAQNCNEGTRVLNCFAHCGAFSVAAASAGASTVSLDLSKKWLDRIEPQIQANGIEFDEKHDCIYGDCFDWLARLSKRGEKYDVVILDPPSSSVGKTMKRWSVKNDMASLVELAAPLVKKGGLLFTTTNSASIHPVKFARICRNGLENAGLRSSKLERIVPMPVDYPSIGAQPVKNLVWRI